MAPSLVMSSATQITTTTAVATGRDTTQAMGTSLFKAITVIRTGEAAAIMGQPTLVADATRFAGIGVNTSAHLSYPPPAPNKVPGFTVAAEI